MSAFGDNPAYHHIVDGSFMCSAPSDARCRTFPTCECENWCCCDEPGQNHDEGDHCCMATNVAGQDCWIEPWISATSVEDSGADSVTYDEDGEAVIPDGAVTCDWDDGIQWNYANDPDQGVLA